MKNIIALFSLFAALLLVSCEDKNEGGVASGLISEVRAVGLHGEIAVEWVIPDTVNFLYVDISYISSKGKPTSKKVSRYARLKNAMLVRDTITGFADTLEYKITLTPYSKDGIPAKSETVTVAPLSPPFAEVFKSIEMLPDFGGAIVVWQNTMKRQVNIYVSYTDNENMTVTKMFSTLSAQQGNISSLSGDEKKYLFFTEDNSGNRSAIGETTVAIFAETRFDKKKWSVPGYDEGSYSETIGYSSQATNEGGAPQGRVAAIFDDDLSTFWHASWSPASNYPHWYIIDFGEEVTISRVEMSRRQGNSQGQIGQQFLTCTAAGATPPENPVFWMWEDQGSYEFDRTINDAQSFRLSNNPKARYLKVYFGQADKGPGNYAMVGEMSVYGQQ